MANDTMSERLASFLVELRRNGAPQGALKAASSLLLDWLGSALAELRSKSGRELLSAIDARYPKEWPAVVRVRLASGETLEAATDRPKGDPEAPLSRSEIAEKFAGTGGFPR